MLPCTKYYVRTCACYIATHTQLTQIIPQYTSITRASAEFSITHVRSRLSSLDRQHDTCHARSKRRHITIDQAERRTCARACARAKRAITQSPAVRSGVTSAAPLVARRESQRGARRRTVDGSPTAAAAAAANTAALAAAAAAAVAVAAAAPTAAAAATAAVAAATRACGDDASDLSAVRVGRARRKWLSVERVQISGKNANRRAPRSHFRRYRAPSAPPRIDSRPP